MAYGFEIPNPTPANAASAMSLRPEETFGDVFAGAPQQRMPASDGSISESVGLPQGPPPMPMQAPPPQPPPDPKRPFADPEMSALVKQRIEKEQEALLAEQEAKSEPAARDARDYEVKAEELDAIFAETDQLFQGYKNKADQQPMGMADTSPETEGAQAETPEQMYQRMSGDPVQFFKDELALTVAKASGGLANSAQEKTGRFAQVWTDPKTGRKLGFEEGQAFIQYSNSKGFVKMPQKQFETVANFILEKSSNPILKLAAKLGPVLPNFLLENFGAATDMGVQAGTALVAAPLVAAATMKTGSPIAGIAVARAADFVGGVGGKLAVRGLQKGVDAVYGEVDLSEKEAETLVSQSLEAGGVNFLLGSGMGGLGFLGAQGAHALGRHMAQGGQHARVWRLHELKNWYKNFVDVYSDKQATGAIAQASKNAHGAISAASQVLKTDVSQLEKKAFQLAEGRTDFKPNAIIEKLKSILEEKGVKIDPKTGKTTLPFEAERAAYEGVEEVTEDAAGDLARAELKERTVFGDPNGRRHLEWLAKQHELLFAARATGGTDMRTIFANLDSFDTQIKYGQNFKASDELQETYETLRNAATMDRVGVFEGVYKGTGLDEAEDFKEAYERFTTNIDSHRQVLKIFQSTKSMGQFMDNNAQSPELMLLLRDKLLGRGSKEWKALKGEYLHRMIENSTEPSSGLFSGHAFMRKMTRDLSKEARDVLFSPREQRQLINMAHTANTIPYSDLITAEQGRAIDVLAGLAPQSMWPTKIRAMFAAVGRNRKALDHIEGVSFRNLAMKAKTVEEKAYYRSGRKYLRTMLDKMRVVQVKRKGVLVDVVVPAAKRAADLTTKQLIRGLPGKMAAPSDTGTLIYEPNQGSENEI